MRRGKSLVPDRSSKTKIGLERWRWPDQPIAPVRSRPRHLRTRPHPVPVVLQARGRTDQSEERNARPRVYPGLLVVAGGAPGRYDRVSDGKVQTQKRWGESIQ